MIKISPHYFLNHAQGVEISLLQSNVNLKIKIQVGSVNNIMY